MDDNANPVQSTWPLSKNQDLLEASRAFDAETEQRLFDALRHFWHPVAYEHEVTDAPRQVWLCGEQLVAVRLNGVACVMNDLCAHRGTALSLGKVVCTGDREDLQCPYHGWRYQSDGRCTLAPQRPDLATKLRARVKSYLTVERYGLVWVCLADAPHFPLPEFPQYDDPTYHTVFVPSTDWAHASAFRRTENYTDPAHLAFVHDGYLGDSSQPAVPAHHVERRENVLHMALDEPCLEPAKAGKNASIVTDREFLHVMKTWDVSMPLTVLLSAKDDLGNNYCLFFHPSPTSPNTLRNFTVGARNFGSKDTIFEEIALWNKLVYEQDEPIVSSQRPESLPEDLSIEMYLQGVDSFSLEYRRWLYEISRELFSGVGDSPEVDGA